MVFDTRSAKFIERWCEVSKWRRRNVHQSSTEIGSLAFSLRPASRLCVDDSPRSFQSQVCIHGGTTALERGQMAGQDGEIEQALQPPMKSTLRIVD